MVVLSYLRPVTEMKMLTSMAIYVLIKKLDFVLNEKEKENEVSILAVQSSLAVIDI